MAITISGENNNDRILASDGVIDSLSGFNVVGVITATSFTGDITGDVTGNLTGNVTGNINNTTLLLQTGGTERVRIASNGKVGVGVDPTNYPGIFVVSGDALICDRDIHSRVANSVANSDRGFKQDIDGTEKLHLYADNSSNIILEGNGGSEKVRIDNNGDVGINVNNPTEKLHVSGNIKVTGQLFQSTPADFWSQSNTFIELNGMGNLTHMGSFETCLTSNGYRDNNAQWKSYATNSTTGAAQIRLNPAGYIVFGTEANKADGDSPHTVDERLRITSTGMVNIGTNNQAGGHTSSSKLRVGTASGSDVGVVVFGNNDTTTPALIITNWDGAQTQNKSIIHFDNSGWGSFQIGCVGGADAFGIFDDSVERLRITSDGDVAITTRGTVEGVSKLNVEIPSRTTAFSASDGDTWHDVLIENPGGATNNAVGLCFQVTGDSYHKNAGTGIAAVKNGTNSDYGADLVFITRPQNAVAQERLRITSDGKVVAGGSGNGYPCRLQSHGPGNLLDLNSTSGAAKILFYESGAGRFNIETLNGSSGLRFYDSLNAKERLRITSNGTVVINNTDENAVHSISNLDHGNVEFNHRGNRVLTSNGAGWDGNSSGDGSDPILVLPVENRTGNTKIGDAYGLCLHSESQDNNDYGPLIGWSNRSNSGNFNTTYAAIVGKKTGQATDSNWSTGEIQFFTGKPASQVGNGSAYHVSGYMNATPDMSINENGAVRSPRQPMVRINGITNTAGSGDSNGGTAVNQVGAITFSSGRVTIHITGTYLITFNTISDSSTGRKDAYVEVNGSSIINLLNEDNGSGYHQKSGSIVIQLQVNDYIDFNNADWYDAGNQTTTWKTASVVMVA